MKEPRFEALWYEGATEQEAYRGDYHTKEFYTRKKAVAFYNEHRNDQGKFGWLVTHRNADWDVIEDIIYR